MSFALTLGASLAVIAGILLSGVQLEAATYTWNTGTSGTFQWTNPAIWTGGPVGSYPGQSAGDVVSLSNPQQQTIQVSAAIPNAVTIQNNAVGVTIEVTAAGTLPLTGTSNFATASSGISNKFKMTGGTVNMPGATLALAGGGLNNAQGFLSGGTVNGGTITVGGSPSAMLAFDGAAGAMTLNGVTINSTGTIDYSAPAGSLLTLAGGSTINNNSGGTLLLTTDVNLLGATGIVNNAGVTTKNNLLSSTFTFDGVFNNVGPNGIVQFQTTAGTIALANGGTHTGNFQQNLSTAFSFSGTHVFNGTAQFSGSCGGCATTFQTGNFTNNTALSIDNFTQNGGTVDGTGTLTLPSAFSWNAGSQSGSGTTTLSTAPLTITGSTPLTLDTGRLLVAGAGGTYTPAAGGGLTINTGATLRNAAGTLVLGNDTQISSDGTGIIDNRATIQKNGGIGTTFLFPVFTATNGSTNSLDVQTGTIRLLGGGSFGAPAISTLNAAAGSFLELGGTSPTYNVNANTSVTAGLTLLDNATLSLNANVNVPNFGQTGTSTLSGTGTMVVGNTYTWDSGTMDGTGTVSLAGSTQSLNMAGATGPMTMKNGHSISATGGSTVKYTSPVSLLSVNSGSTITVGGGSSFNLPNSLPIMSDGLSSPAITVNSGGTLVKNATGTTTINPAVNDSGGIVITNGSLALAGGGQISGGVTTNAASQFVSIPGPGTVTLTGPPGINGPGTFLVNGGTLTNSATTTINSPLELKSGTINGSGILGVGSGGMKWEGGTMQGPGQTIVPVGALLDATAPLTQLNLDGRTLSIGGLFTVNPTQPLSLQNNSVLTVNAGGTVDVQGNGNLFATAGSSLNNQGLIKKTGGSSTYTIHAPITNSGAGTIDSQTGGGSSISIDAGGSFTGGTLKAGTAGANLDFSGGTSMLAGAALSGPGSIRITNSGATVQVNTPTAAPVDFEQLDGTLLANSVFTVPNAAVYFWSAGGIGGAGGVTVANGGLLAFDTTTSQVSLTSTTLNILSGGTARWSGGSNPMGLTLSSIANGGLFDIQANGTFLTGGPGCTITNTGTFQRSVTGGIMFIDPPTANSGTFDVQTGTVKFSSNLTNTGVFSVGAGATFEMTAGTLALNAGSSLTGTGTIKINAGTVSVNTPLTAPQALDLSSGTLTVNSPLTANGNVTWTGATINGGSSISASNTTISPATTNATLSAATFTNTGTASLTGTSPTIGLLVTAGATVNNTAPATFNIADRPILGSATFNNAGVFQKNSGAGIGAVAPTFNNTGSVNVQSGQLRFTGNGTDTGTYAATVAGTTLEFFGGTRTISAAGGINAGAGSGLLFTGGTVTDSGALTDAGGFSLNGGSLIYNGGATATLGSFTNVLAGSFGGSGGAQLGGTSSWTGGTIGGSGLLTLPSGTLTINGATTNPTLDGRQLSNFGTILSNSTSFAPILKNAAQIVDNAGSFFNMTTDIGVQQGGLGTSTITNNGTFQKMGGAGTSTIGPLFLNGNTVNLITGTTAFAGAYTQVAGNTFLGGGNMSVPFSSTNFNSGTLTGNGTITTSDFFNNGATVNPGLGATPGALALTGNYTQAAGGTLHADLASAASFDKLNVGGAANLAGNLDVAFAGGYTPAGGQSFPILTFASKTGDFTMPYNLPAYPGGSWQSAYTPTSLVLTATSPADLGVTIGGPATVGAGQSTTYSVNVTNGGPNAASGNTLNVNVANGNITTVNTSGGGWSCGSITATTATCTQASIPNGGSSGLSVTVQAPLSGNITIGATVSSATFDSSTANNSASATTTVTPLADLWITKSGPSMITPNTNVTYSISVMNSGPSASSNLVINDNTPSGTTFVSLAGPCAAFPCNVASLPAGQSLAFSAVYHVNATSGSITNVAVVTSSTVGDPNSANNSASTTGSILSPCPKVPVNLLPAEGVTNVPPSGMLSWNPGSNAQNFNVYFGPAGSGCSTLLGTTPARTFPYNDLQPGTEFEWRVEGVSPNCPVVTAACVRFKTANNCSTQPPSLISPAEGAVVASPVTFSWSAVPGASSYALLSSSGGGEVTLLGNTAGTSLTAEVPGGPIIWFVIASFPNGSPCGPLQSATRTFNVCGMLPAPLPSVVGEATSGSTYSVEWTAIAGASQYQIDESTNQAFDGGTSQTVAGTKVSFTHAATLRPTAYFYRIRAIAGCNQQAGPFSSTIRVVVVPVTPANQQNPSANVPAGSTRIVLQQVFIDGVPGPALYTYSAVVDKPWLGVSPPTGVLPVDGVTLDVSANPADLPNGTFTGTVIVTITQVGAGKTGSQATGAKTVPVPISINLVTPVTTGPATSPQASSLIIPSVGHLDGVNSHWQSDIRVTNTSTDKQKYQLIFTPQGDDGSRNVKTTTIDVAGGDTTALDDIVRNWYGIGSLGDSANGVLEIRPLTGSLKGLGSNDTSGAKATAVASSRTYNVSGNGTLGQYIPAIPFASFIGRSIDPKVLASVLSLQQVAQSDAFRTNLGVVEASGQPATVLLSIFDNTGLKLKDLSLDLKGGEQRQMNGFLAANNIALTDGRIEVKVTNGNGKVTAYASVIDNKTGDPLLVSGVPLSATSNNKYVLPGVADLNNGLASWRTDMRIFNNSTTPQAATLLFYPQNNGGQPSTKDVNINPGEVRTLDNVLQTLFGQTNVGGAMHITTPGNSSLVVTGRTYNQTPDGTFGQFINAVTPFDAVGKADRSLQILQVEDSVRYRTNLGLAEVSGREANVEITVFLPDSKVSPKLSFTLQPNEFRQLGIIRDLGLGNIYNARISVRVTDGDGRVTAYGSVIDMTTQDPTYVPAQ